MSSSNQSRAALARDAAIARVRRTRRWVIVGTAALTAGIAALVSAVAPGKSLASKSKVRTEASTGGSSTTGTSSAGSASSAVPQLPPVANPSSLGLQAPGQAPQSVPNPPQTQTQTQTQSAPAPQTSSPPPVSAPTPPSSSSSSGGGGVVSGGS